MKKWESLGEEAKAVISEVIIEAENRVEEGSDFNLAATEELKKAQAENGIETITFEGADAERWLSAAKESAWKEFLEQNPENGQELMKLFTKSN